MAERSDSRTLSSATLAAGVRDIEQQAVKQEQTEEKALMEKELQDYIILNWKRRCPTKMVGFQISIFLNKDVHSRNSLGLKTPSFCENTDCTGNNPPWYV